MKIFWTGIVMAVILCTISLAQEASPSPQTNGAPPSQDQQNPPTTQSAAPKSAQAAPGFRIAPGSVIPVQLTKTIDAKKAKTGDEVQAKVTQDMKNQGGEVLVPKDTKVLGHITQAQARSKDQPQSEVGIAFDHAVMKDKGDVPLPLSIQAIIAPPNSSANNAAAAESPAETPSPGMSQDNSGGGQSGARSSGMSSGNQSPAPTPAPSAGEPTNGGQSTAGARPPITGQTQGVVGISNLKLETAAANSTQGSLVRSEKDNVKLESGTFMLLRVNQ